MIYKVQVKIPVTVICPLCNNDHGHICGEWRTVSSSDGRNLIWANREGAQKYIETYCNYQPEKFRIITL